MRCIAVITDGSKVLAATNMKGAYELISVHDVNNLLTVSDACEAGVTEDTVFVVVGEVVSLGKVPGGETRSESCIVDRLHIHVVVDLEMSGQRPPG